jgi:tol-pal system protein YbgF
MMSPASRWTAARRPVAAFLLLAGLALPLAAGAQSVADVRSEVDVLNGQIQQLRDQLVQQGASGGLPVAPATALERLDQLESELRRLTNRVDVLTNDIDRIVTDASNRAGDIEFRLTEIEGGDTSTLGPPEPLGGGVTMPRPRPRTPTAATGSADTQLAVAEKSDFDAALAAANEGRPGEAATMFDTFLATYPGSPLAGRAKLARSDALGAAGDWQGAARGYLDTFSGAPQDDSAPEALLGLGIALAKLGKTENACLTLDEVGIRYPASPAVQKAAAEKARLSCP